ncbi:hypothetical protein Acsp01_34950 [Actinoplanes sp. NBRC 101535]|nr:hypothetical protein Acsp01_34950 [Actinoplanes sp. NBRC 101535]
MSVGFLAPVNGGPPALLAEAFARSPVAKVVISLAPGEIGCLVEVNEAFCALTGRDRTALIGYAYPLLLPEEDRTAATLGFETMARGEPPPPAAERLMVRPDGTRTWVSGGTVIAHDGVGRPYAITELTDVTAARRSQQLFEALLDASPDMLILTTLDGTVVHANSTCERILGWTADDLAGVQLSTLRHPDDTPAGDGAPVTSARFRYRCKDGDYRWIQWAGSVVPDQELIAATGRDVTDAVNAELASARETDRLRTTIRVHREINAVAADRAAAMRVVARRMVGLFGSADGAAVLIVDGSQLVLAAAAGELGALTGTKFPIAGSLAGLALTEDTIKHCRDSAVDSRVHRDASVMLGVRSVIVSPLHGEQGGNGVLLVSAQQPNAFEEGDEHQFSLLADSLSAALRHADDTAQAAALLAERTRALAALEISENRFRLTFENSPLGLTLASLAPGSLGHYLQANPAMSAITGYSADELCRMSFADLQHSDDVPRTRAMIERLAAGDLDTVRIERRYVHKRGHVIWVSIRVAVVREKGRARFVVNQVEDVTARRAADAELRRQARLLELIPAAVIVRDMDGTIRWWNQGATDLYGWPISSAHGRSIHDLLHTVFPADSTIGDLREHLMREGRWEGELDHVTADGHTLTVLSRQVLHHPPGAEPQILEINTDVSPLRAAERALAGRNTELEAANTLKLDIIGMLGHEIGNPLTAIRGHAEILADDWEDLDEAYREKAVAAIIRQTGRLDDIVREVLAMVTIETGSITADRRRLRARDEISQALAAVDSESLPVDSRDDDVTVLANPGHLQQILVNLLSNAKKYGGGATAVHIDADGGRVHITVEDNGRGVPEEFRHRLFHRMARADRDARRVQGTGLGLYIVRGLARANQGEVRHEPNPRGGSLFVLSLEQG